MSWFKSIDANGDLKRLPLNQYHCEHIGIPIASSVPNPLSVAGIPQIRVSDVDSDGAVDNAVTISGFEVSDGISMESSATIVRKNRSPSSHLRAWYGFDESLDNDYSTEDIMVLTFNETDMNAALGVPFEEGMQVPVRVLNENLYSRNVKAEYFIATLHHGEVPEETFGPTHSSVGGDSYLGLTALNILEDDAIDDIFSYVHMDHEPFHHFWSHDEGKDFKPFYHNTVILDVGMFSKAVKVDAAYDEVKPALDKMLNKGIKVTADEKVKMGLVSGNVYTIGTLMPNAMSHSVTDMMTDDTSHEPTPVDLEYTGPHLYKLLYCDACTQASCDPSGSHVDAWDIKTVDSVNFVEAGGEFSLVEGDPYTGACLIHVNLQGGQSVEPYMFTTIMPTFAFAQYNDSVTKYLLLVQMPKARKGWVELYG